MKIAWYNNQLCQIAEELPNGTVRLQTVTGEGIGLQNAETIIADARFLRDIVDVSENNQYKNWVDAMAAVDALLDADGLLPELTAVVVHQENCQKLFMEFIHTNRLNHQDSPIEITPKSTLPGTW